MEFKLMGTRNPDLQRGLENPCAYFCCIACRNIFSVLQRLLCPSKIRQGAKGQPSF